ncbi:hypothetical protein [Streptomyces bacillaris]
MARRVRARTGASIEESAARAARASAFARSAVAPFFSALCSGSRCGPSS